MGIIGGTFRAAGILAARGAAAVGNKVMERLSPVTIAQEVGAASMRAGSQGAAELAQALYTGNGFVPYGPTERPLEVIQANAKGNVHGTGTGQQQAAAQVEPPQRQQATGWGHQSPMGHREIGHSQNAKIIDMQPQIEARRESYQQRLDHQAARMANKPRDEGRER